MVHLGGIGRDGDESEQDIVQHVQRDRVAADALDRRGAHAAVVEEKNEKNVQDRADARRGGINGCVELVVQGKETQEFVEFVLEPEILQEVRLGYEAVLNPDLLLPRLGIDESGKGDFFGPLCIAGVYINESVIHAWEDAGIRDSKNISSDHKIAELAKLIRQTPGCVTSVVPIGKEMVWLDTTTEIAPFRLLTYNLRKKKALVIPPSGEPQLMETPADAPVANTQIVETEGKVSDLGKLSARVKLMFSGDSVFFAPAYPLENVFDPTGAGDSFAGGFIGYLARTGDLSDANMRRAVIYGSALGSFAVEEFSTGRLMTLQRREVDERVRQLRQLTTFEEELPE